MLRLLRLASVLFMGLLFVIMLSPYVQRSLYRKGFIPEMHPYGDLYHRTHLAQFKEKDYLKNKTLTDADKPTHHYADVDVYTIGDSFTEIDTSFYAGHRNKHIWLTFNQETATLDSTKKNILIIEILERIILERLAGPPSKNVYIKQGYHTPEQDNAQPAMALSTNQASLPTWLFQRFTSDIEWRIDVLWFDYSFFAWFKELKARLNQNWFNRVPQGVLSSDFRHLFYDIEAEPMFTSSSFYPISNACVDSIVTTLNFTRAYYRSMGFNEVYYAFVPNKVTVLDPNRRPYNQLIKRIETHPHLQSPLISLYDTLRQHPDWYHKGDGHWNRFGKKYWLRRVNDTAKKWSVNK